MFECPFPLSATAVFGCEWVCGAADHTHVSAVLKLMSLAMPVVCRLWQCLPASGKSNPFFLEIGGVLMGVVFEACE